MIVYKKLNEARTKFHSLKLEKTGHNKFAGYKYFELGDFLIPALKVFSDCGLCAVVTFTSDVASMTITSLEDASQIVLTSPMGSAALKGCHEVQNIGAVETYQRRYLWVAALEIVEHDALDATTGKSAPVITATQGALEVIPADQREYLQELAMECVDLIRKQNPLGAWLRIERDNLDDEQKTALWTMLDSKSRSAIKAAKPQPQKEPA